MSYIYGTLMTETSHMPKGVLNINIISATSVIGFAVLLGTLNLYLQKRGLPIEEVNILTAVASHTA